MAGFQEKGEAVRLVDEIKKIVDGVSYVAARCAFIAGGLSLSTYTLEVKQFPSGVGLGDGLAFYLVSIAWILWYALYLMSIASVGSLLMYFPFTIIQAIKIKASNKTGGSSPAWHNVSFSAMVGADVIAFAVFGLFFLLVVFAEGDAPWWAYPAPVIAQGTLVGLWVGIKRLHEIDCVGLVIPMRSDYKAINRMKFRERLVKVAIPLLFLLIPFVFMPDRTSIVKMAFSAAQIRQERVTVHIKKPWYLLINKEKLNSSASPLGPNYVRIECATVMLSGIGDIVVIDRNSLAQPKGKDGKCAISFLRKKSDPVSIPKDAIWVE